MRGGRLFEEEGTLIKVWARLGRGGLRIQSSVGGEPIPSCTLSDYPLGALSVGGVKKSPGARVFQGEGTPDITT